MAADAIAGSPAGSATGARRIDVGWPTLDFDGLGTLWQIASATPLATRTERAVLDEVARFDRTWSRFRDDSAVSALAGASTERMLATLPPEAAALFDYYDRLESVTDGAVSRWVHDPLTDLGYGGGRRGIVDVGAAGKGLLVDLLAAILDDAGHDAYVVDGSGDLFHRGPQPLRVALEDPRDAGRAIGVAELPSGSALAASALNRRRWRDRDGIERHHMLDARTGLPLPESPASITATWAIGASAMIADGAATALFFVSAALIGPTLGVQGVRMSSAAAAEFSLDFPGEVFTA